MDFRNELNPKICADITKPIPGLADGCAEYVSCLHVLEHLLGDSYYAAMMEMARLLKSGGIFDIKVPHPSSDCAMVHGHIHVLTPQWWRQMRDDNWLRGKLIIDDITEVFDPEFLADREKIDGPPERLYRYLRNVYNETHVHGHKP